MPPSSGNANDYRVEQIIGNLLRTGVILAVSVMLAGGIYYLSRHANDPSGHHTFEPEKVPLYLKDMGEIVTAAVQGNSLAIMQVGLLLLILTPVARVVFTVFAFLWERDYLYLVITLIVLSILLYSLLEDQL
jgi:uncharacterized membrane protein